MDFEVKKESVMFNLRTDWNPKQTALKGTLSKPEGFNEAIRLCLELHGLVHSGKTVSKKTLTFFDELLDGLTEEAFAAMSAPKDTTIAWNIWHITRIEDITANILIANGKQVLNNTWLKKLGTPVRDTGNAMTKDEILHFSRSLKMDMLISYRDEVGRRTRDIVKNLKQPDLKRKMRPESVARILDEGGVTSHKDSVWLLEFWGKKTVAGILLMPLTRHQILHLNGSMNLKKKIMKQRQD
jgi:hypothetical protein